jgi:hypothetical protein
MRARIYNHIREAATERKVQWHLTFKYSLYFSFLIDFKYEMGGACSAYGGEERRIQGFGGET